MAQDAALKTLIGRRRVVVSQVSKSKPGAPLFADGDAFQVGFGRANLERIWCARRDSNSRPNAPEAFALSS